VVEAQLVVLSQEGDKPHLEVGAGDAKVLLDGWRVANEPIGLRPVCDEQ
jgi:hypothetical protein